MSRTTMPPSEEGAYWHWPEPLPDSKPMLLWVSTCVGIDAFVATECPDGLAYRYVTDLPGRWEGPLQPYAAGSEGTPNLPAMKIAFLAAWPWLARALEQETDLWHDAGIDVESKVPDEPFIAALRAAWTHTAMISEDRHD